MTETNDIEKAKDIIRRADALRNKYTDSKPTDDGANTLTEAERQGSRIGSSFLATILAGCLIGYLFDTVTGLSPWGLFFFIFMAFFAGVVRAQHATKALDEAASKDTAE